MNCGRARKTLVEHLHGRAGEAVLLSLDLHLEGCAECRAERARLATLGALRDWQPPALSDTARHRIVESLTAAAAERAPAPLPRRSGRPFVYASFGALAAAAALLFFWRAHRPFDSAPQTALRSGRTESPKPVAVAKAPEAPSAPTVRFLDADLGYAPDTRANLQLDTRTVHLESGQLDVVRRAGATPLRISTPHFVVALTQGHAKFGADSVQVIEGEVYVFSFDQKQLATVAAGQTWHTDPSAPAIASTAPAPAAPALSVPAALDHARAALARGEGNEARHYVQRALHGAASQRERAEGELFLAESWLIESDADKAVAAYRKVAAAFPSLPEGEAAAFAAAQVLSERGRTGEAAESLKSYLARWPEGRFAREAQERLSALPQ
jgi:hypothetical protein